MLLSRVQSTVAMITTSAMIASMMPSRETLGFHPVYLATAIGGASLIGSWMNDSGFWIFAEMAGLTEGETIRTWTPLLAIVGLAAVIVSFLLATVLPMA